MSAASNEKAAKIVKHSSKLTAVGAMAPMLALVAGLLVGGGSAVAEVVLRLDPAKIMGADKCGECHKPSVEAWRETRHFKTFQQIHRTDEAKAIAKKMGIKSIKSRKSACAGCHFTFVAAKRRPISGITCESCHGAAKGWMDVHNDYGGKKVKRETETAEHRRQRVARSVAAGMIKPVRTYETAGAKSYAGLYDIAANCYSCHTVPNEELVNNGGHPAGSPFDLVAWTQGEVRHNIFYSEANGEATANARRVMYVVGKALDLEFALRGVAKATKKAKYAVSMARRAAAARKALQKIAAAVSAPELTRMIALAKKAKLRLNNGPALTKAADGMAALTKTFARNHDGSAFGAVDSMIPKKMRGTPAK